MQLAEIYLEAVNPLRDCSRAYRITLIRDLFGTFMVQTRYGRIGTYGHTLGHSFEAEGDARQFIQGCLRRRQGSVKRIGVRYETKQVWSAPGTEPLLPRSYALQ